MKVGINLMLYTGTPNFKEHEALLEKLHGFGYDAFELCVGDLSPDEIAKFAKKAVDLGMEAQAVDLFSVDIADPIGHDPNARRAAIDRLKLSAHKARDLGAKIYSGTFFQGLCSTTSIGPTDEERKWAVETLYAVGKEAQTCGLKIAAEPLNRFEMHIVNTIEKAYALCVATGLDNVGIMADTHHSNIEELDLVKAYVDHIDRIFNIQISENNRGTPGSGHGIPTNLFDAVLHAGYQGNFIIESFNANVPATLPLLRIWEPLVPTEDEIAIEGLKFIRNNIHR